MNRYFSLIQLLIYWLCASYFIHGQNRSIENISLSFGPGMTYFEKDMDIDFLRTNFPESKEVHQDFSVYTAKPHKDILDLKMNADVAIVLNRKDTSWKKPLIPKIRLNMGFSREKLAGTELKKETFLGNSLGVQDTLNRETYILQNDADFIYTGIDLLLHNKFFGEDDRFRVYFGLGVTCGIGLNKLDVSYSSVNVMAIKTSNDPGNYNILNHGEVISRYDKDTKYQSDHFIFFERIHVPLGIEVANKSKRFLLGLEFKLGGLFLQSKSIGNMNASSERLNLSIKYMLKKKG